MENKPVTVWVAHFNEQRDYSAAARYGTLQAVTQGRVNVFQPEQVRNEVRLRMKNYHPDDYIVLCGHVVVNFFILMEAFHKAEQVKTLIFGARHNDYQAVLFEKDWLEGAA